MISNHITAITHRNIQGPQTHNPPNHQQSDLFNLFNTTNYHSFRRRPSSFFAVFRNGSGSLRGSGGIMNFGSAYRYLFLSSPFPFGLAPLIINIRLFIRLDRPSYAYPINAAANNKKCLTKVHLIPTNLPHLYSPVGNAFLTHKRNSCRYKSHKAYAETII